MPETRDALRVVRQRIDALRLLHDKLYLAGDVDRVDLGAYLGELAGTLLRFHAQEDMRVRLVLELRRLIVPPSQAAPVGLIVNEFITNSLKYAFDEHPGTIGLRLDPARGGTARLLLWDDGKGLPGDRSGVTGMRLIEGLVRQMSGRLDWVVGGQGTRLSLVLTPPVQI